jgi:hypothetical protein
VELYSSRHHLALNDGALSMQNNVSPTFQLLLPALLEHNFCVGVATFADGFKCVPSLPSHRLQTREETSTRLVLIWRYRTGRRRRMLQARISSELISSTTLESVLKRRFRLWRLTRRTTNTRLHGANLG